MNTPDAKIGYATRILQNMLDAGDIGTLPTDTEQRLREMLATLREAQAEVVEMRADRPQKRKFVETTYQVLVDRPRQARKPGKWFQAITGQMQEVRR
jgi:hypothetical protein